MRRLATWIGLALLVGLGLSIGLSTPWGNLVRPDPGRADFTAGQLARSAAYVAAARPPELASLLLAALLALAIGLHPLGRRLAPPWQAGWRASLAAGLAASLLVQLALLPLAAWAQAVDRHYRLASGSWWTWLRLQAEGRLLTALLAGVGVALVQAVVRRLPRAWWAVLAMLGAGLVVAGSLLAPVVVDPITAHVYPMPAGPQKSELLALAAAHGVHLPQIYLSEPVAASPLENAYVAGIGPTKRLVLYRSLLRAAPPDQVRSVFAHELGHWVHRDIERGTGQAAAGIAALGALAPWVADRRWLRRRYGGLGDPRAAALLLGVLAAGSLALAPGYLTVSRHVEAAADRYALTITADPAAFVASQQRITLADLIQPQPPQLLHVLLGSHPSTLERIALARRYAAAAGRPLPAELARP